MGVSPEMQAAADTHRRLFVNGLDDKLLIVKGNVSDLTPGEADLWGQSEEDRTPTSPLNSTQNNRTRAPFESLNNFVYEAQYCTGSINATDKSS